MFADTSISVKYWEIAALFGGESTGTDVTVRRLINWNTITPEFTAGMAQVAVNSTLAPVLFS